jgi:hypothetical protein
VKLWIQRLEHRLHSRPPDTQTRSTGDTASTTHLGRQSITQPADNRRARPALTSRFTSSKSDKHPQARTPTSLGALPTFIPTPPKFAPDPNIGHNHAARRSSRGSRRPARGQSQTCCANCGGARDCSWGTPAQCDTVSHCRQSQCAAGERRRCFCGGSTRWGCSARCSTDVGWHRG